MHLAILTQYYRPEIGAPQARLSNLASHFVRRGHSVTVLTAMPNYPIGKVYDGYAGLLRREKLEGIDIVRTFIYPTTKTDFVRRLTNYFSFVITSSLVGTILLKKVDFLLVESPPLFLGLTGILLSRLKGARLIFNVSDLWPESAVRLGMIEEKSWSYRCSAWLEKLCYRSAWLVTGQSKGILASISERFPHCRTFHLSNGADISRYLPETFMASNDGEQKESFVLLYAGLHGLAQGLAQLLDAAEQLQDQKEFRFLLVGDGPEKKELVQRAQQRRIANVEFLDPRPAEEVPALLAAADVLLVPLGLDLPGAVPSKLYEAMASGRPVVLVASGEAAEIVREHHAGITIMPGELKELVAALRRLKAEPALRKEFGNNGRKAATLHYDRKKIADRFINHLEQNSRLRHSTDMPVSTFHLDQDTLN